jgi:threonyl-tRNA synthetase
MSKVKEQLNNDPLAPLRHSAEHVLHKSVELLFPGALKVMGPAIENGFYHDYDYVGKISEDDLPRLEAKMQEIIDAKLPINQRESTFEEVRGIFKDNQYKLDTIDEIESKGEIPSVVEMGEKGGVFYDIDLCKGPHVKSTGKIKAFKLLSLAGAYYKGDENNKMLGRIYGTAFDSPEKLQEHLNFLEDVKKRDHRKIGKELDLFSFSPLIGPGLPVFTPKGTVIKEELQKHIERICYDYGFDKVMTPHLAKISLYEKSGHAKKFGEELFHVSAEHGQEFVMKPVQCPHQTQIYASKPRSYRDLPIRYMESEKQYRAEKPGEVGGLNRVYAITVEDGHTFCRVDQIKEELKGMVKIVEEFYSALGLWGNHWVSLSVRDYDHPEKYIGEPEDWDECEKMLQEVSAELGLAAVRCEGEAALYGPKLDFMFKDALGKDIQIPTVQVDFATPKRFGLEYTNQEGKKVPPVMVHRAVLGSYERLMALLIEYFVGAFPVWLSPVQAAIIPIGEKHIDYAKELAKKMKKEGLRVEVNDKDNKMQAKIREAQMQKVPYMLIIGDREVENEEVSVRLRSEENKGAMKTQEMIAKIKSIYLTKSLELW